MYLSKEVLGVIVFTAAVGIAMLSLAPTHQELNELPEYDCRHHNNCQFYGLNQ